MAITGRIVSSTSLALVLLSLLMSCSSPREGGVLQQDGVLHVDCETASAAKNAVSASSARIRGLGDVLEIHSVAGSAPIGRLEVKNCASFQDVEIMGAVAEEVVIENSQVNSMKLEGIPHLKIRNVEGAGDVEINGGSGTDYTVERSRLGRLTIRGITTRGRIQDNELGGLTLKSRPAAVSDGGPHALSGGGEQTYAATIIGNILRSTNQNTVDIMYDGDLCGSEGAYGGYLLERNVITQESSVEFERCAALRIMCRTHNTAIGNVFYADACSGVYLRDNADQNTFRYNIMWKRRMANSYGGGLRYEGGNDPPKHEPANNVYEHNLVRHDDGPAFLGSVNSGGNQYRYNAFLSKTGSSDAYLGTWVNACPRHLSSATDEIFLRNTFLNAGPGPAVQIAGDPGCDAMMQLRNNILASEVSVVVDDGDGKQPSTWSRFSSDYNVFSALNGSPPLFGAFGGFEGWKSTTGGDENSVTTNPQFTDRALFYTDGAIQRAKFPSLIPQSGASSNAGAFLSSNAGCTENWVCSPWSVDAFCRDGVNVRSCRDLNECRTVTARPALTQPCGSGPGPTPTATPTRTPTARPSPTATATPKPTSTPVPGTTPTPQPTESPNAQPTPSPTVPFDGDGDSRGNTDDRDGTSREGSVAGFLGGGGCGSAGTSSWGWILALAMVAMIQHKPNPFRPFAPRGCRPRSGLRIGGISCRRQTAYIKMRGGTE